jgi:hypothetical protein
MPLVSRAEEASELRMLLRRELIARLEGADWTAVDEGREQKAVLVRVLRPIASGFEATAEVDLVSALPDRPPVMVNNLLIGVAYKPLRRLWPLLGDRFELALLGTSTRWPDSADGENERDDDEDDGLGEGALLEVASHRDVPESAETLAQLIRDRAVPYAEQHASLGALLGVLEDDEDPDWVDIRVPAVLAAAGRFDEAAAALDRYEPPKESDYFSRRERRTAYQLRRWVSSRGDESLLPKESPPSRFDEPSRRSFSQLRAESRARRDAVEQVRDAARGRDRDEVRKMLEEALDQRGLAESPLWYERTLDHLWDTPADRVRLGVRALKGLGRLGLGVVKAVREHEWPDISRPDWIAPPDPAFYEVPGADRWTMVSLASGVDGWLERVYQAARPQVFDVATVDAWLKPETPDSGMDKIGVYVGEQRVGVVPHDAVAAYLPILEAATFREELPFLQARLTRRGQPASVMLELVQPTP